MSATDRETARLTADVVALAAPDGVPHVLLIRRGWDPFAGLWALPGGHVDPGEDVEHAAGRELTEETGLTADALVLIGVYSTPGRDPRGRYVTFAYRADLDDMPTPTAADDAVAARWVPVADALADRVAFDHAQIISDAITPPARREAPMACRHKNTDSATQQTGDGALTRTWCTTCGYLLSSTGTGTSTGQIITTTHRRNETTGRMDKVAEQPWDDRAPGR